jgi:hypothetical protein
VKAGGREKRIWRREKAEGGAAQLQQSQESWRRGGRRLRRRGAGLEDGWELVAGCVRFFTAFCFSIKSATQIRKTHCHTSLTLLARQEERKCCDISNSSQSTRRWKTYGFTGLNDQGWLTP